MPEFAAFLAVVLTGLALVPGGAHLFELVNKMRLDQRDYFIVQSIYRGWQLVGVLILAALAAVVWSAALHRYDASSFSLFAAGAALIAATLVVFFVWTLPANKATGMWTTQPPDWRALRRRWEFSHAASAILMVLALACVSAAASTADGSAQTAASL